MLVSGSHDPNHIAIPYQMAETGDYDFWLINFRGNMESRQHAWLDPDYEEEFWNFSFEEFGQEDIRSAVEYIQTTKYGQLSSQQEEKVTLIGYS
mmetsp:Transcript_16461/g.27944  ORF Transcript_16461/g.27944 Transcript_16461/m.27944 type:complete len:94 (+) Transcript_16461:313-594(+)